MSDSPLRILVVEADSDFRHRLHQYLSEDLANEYEIRETATASEAIETCAAWSPDALLVAVGLPDGHGMDVLRAIRSRTGAVAVPLVLMCRPDQIGIRAEALAAGAQQVLIKDDASGDNLSWIVGFAVEKAAMHQALDQRQRELETINRQLEKNVKTLEREIGDREKAEDAVRRSEARFRSIFECKMVPMGIWRTDGSVTAANESLLELIDRTRFDLESGDIRLQSLIVHGEGAEGCDSIVQRLSDDGAAPFEARILDASGRLIPVLMGGAAFPDSEQLGFFFAASLADRKQVEADLRASKDRYMSLTVASAQAVWTTDAAGFADDIPDWRALTGQTIEEVRGLGWLDALHPDDRRHTAETWASCIESRSKFETEYRIRMLTGEYRTFAVRGVPVLEDDGSVREWVGTCTDITDRRQAVAEREDLLERERDARAIAEIASHTKDEFLAVVSHELRAPLNAILGWARILQTKSVGPETMTQAIETIERSARAQSNIIDDLLDTARITSGKLRLEVRPIDIAAVVDAAVDVVRPAADAKSIEILRVFDPEIDVISGDADRLQQVMWNLLSNAVRFTPSGGQIVVRLERVDPVVRIQVSDTGKGIPADFLPQAFNRFDQADRTSTRRHGGLGLGLSLARYLVEAHGGTISAESGGVDKGSTFTISLPLRALRESVAAARPDVPEIGAPPIPHDLGGLRILVVDDEADARDLLATLLSGYGAMVTTVSSSADAYTAFTAATDGLRFDVVVSDIGLPDEDGYSLIRRIRALAPNRNSAVPAVALTAYGRTVDRVKALSAGFQMHVPKPVEPIELAVVIATLTRRPAIQAAE